MLHDFKGLTENGCPGQADARAPEAQPAAWQLDADLEALAWSPHSPTQFLASDESGTVSCIDARAGADERMQASAIGQNLCVLHSEPAGPVFQASHVESPILDSAHQHGK